MGRAGEIVSMKERRQSGASRDTRTIMLNPRMAKEWYEGRRANRLVNRDMVEQYARDMKRGRWTWCGDTIRFNDRGEMMDGQHRCLAVMQSGATIEVLVLRDIPDERMHVIDRGRVRSRGQILSLEGVKYANQVSGVATALWRWRASGGQDVEGKKDPTMHETEDIVRNEGTLIQEAVEFIGGRAAGMGGAAMWGMFYILFSQKDKEGTKAFFARVLEGLSLGHSDPEFHLRKQLIDAKVQKRPMMRHELASKTIRCWNARRGGEPMGKLIWRTAPDGSLPGLPKIA